MNPSPPELSDSEAFWDLFPISIRKVQSSAPPPPSEGGEISPEWLDSEENFPEKVVASPRNHFALESIHEIILRRLHQEPVRVIPGLEAALEQEKVRILQPQTVLERQISREKRMKWQKKIDAIRSGKRWKKYLTQAQPFLEAYRTMPWVVKKIDFLSLDSERALESENEFPLRPDQMKILEAYLQLASKYLTIEVIRPLQDPSRCPCGENLAKVTLDEEGIQQCPSCGAERFIYGYPMSQKDLSKNLSRSDYIDSENFRKALIRYQGKQPDKIPASLYRDLDTYFLSQGSPPSEEILARPLNRRERKDGTDLPMMFKALQETGYSAFYEDANLICAHSWGWKLPDVSALESVIMSDYEKTQKVYNQLYKERSSSLGTQYRLFKHLEMRGHPCSVDDFKIVKMRESLELHEKLWKAMCDECHPTDPGIFFIPTI